MAKAFYCIRAVALSPSGKLIPNFPAGFLALLQVIGDIRLISGDPAPADHKHAVSGAIALGTDHYHWVFYNGSIVQECVGGVDHSHASLTGIATHFMVFVMTSDAQYDQLLIDVPNIIIVGQSEVTENDDGSFNAGLIVNTAWDGATRTAWENRIDNFGLELPLTVTNDRRLVKWLLGAFLAPSQAVRDEQNYRMTSFVIDW